MRRSLIISVLLVVALGLLASFAVAQETVSNTVEEVAVEVRPIEIRPAPQVAAAAAEQLPITGFDTWVWVLVGAGLVTAGTVAVVATRRKAHG